MKFKKNINSDDEKIEKSKKSYVVSLAITILVLKVMEKHISLNKFQCKFLVNQCFQEEEKKRQFPIFGTCDGSSANASRNTVEPLDDMKIIKNKDGKGEGEEAAEVPPNISFFSLFRYSTTKDRFLIIFGILAAIASGLCTPANIFIFGRLINSMLEKGGALLDPTNPDAPDMELAREIFLKEIKEFASYNSIIGAVMFIGTYISILFFNYAALNQIFTIRTQYFKSALNQDIGWYDLNQSGEFASRMNEDLIKLGDSLGEKVGMFIHYMTAFLSSIILAFVLGWELALICLTSLPVTFISFGFVSYMTSKLSKQEMEEYAKAGSVAEEVFSAIRTVFAFGGQDKETVRYTSKLSTAKSLNIKKGFYSGIGFGLLWFFIYASYALAFWYGVGLVIKHKRLPEDEVIYTPDVMFTVFFSVMMASMNFGISSPFIEAFGIGKGAAAKVYSTIERVPEINTLSTEGKAPNIVEGHISFQDVHFNYPSRKDVKVLKGLNLDIRRGQTVALVGSSGCGKSTCVQLIQRFYDPLNGKISLDGVNIKDLNVSWLRSRIGVVGQEPVLFGTTIYENIRYGKENATKDEIECAAKSANAHNFIKQLPNGYDTMVGERGAQMSGGQKQRIAIARALVKNPEILLLDEATSALDTASEAKVQAALENASKGRTTVIIAHRLTTIRNADKIFVFENGQVVEDGTHEELMKIQNGHYFKLVTTQVHDDLNTTDKVTKTTYNVLQSIDDDEQEIVEDPNLMDDSELGEAPQLSVFEILKWNKTEWPYITMGTIGSIFMGGAMPLFALVFGNLIQVMSLPDEDEIRAGTDQYSLYFVIIGIVVGIATFLQIYTYGIAGEILTERIRGKLFQTMLHQEIGWFDDKTNGTGTLCAKLSGEAAAVQGATGQRVGTVFQSIATLTIAIGLSMFHEWRLALVSLAFFPFMLVAFYMDVKYSSEQHMGSAKALEKSTKLGVEVVSNIRTVVSLGREEMFYNQYVGVLQPSLIQAKRNTHFRAVVFAIARSLMFFAFAACILYGGYLVADSGVEIGKVFIVTQAIIMGSMSIANSIAFAPNFQKGILAAAKVNQLYERQPKIQDPVPLDEASANNWQSKGNVTYYKTEFFYPSRPSSLVLNGLDINIKEGQTIALVGSSGCGKSTCIQLLERFYDSTNGYVAVDDKIVTSVTLKSLRSQMGIVSQEPSLFDRTIADNIAYGDNSRDVSMDEVINAAKNANIHNFIITLPLGYETRLGEKGTQLSGGQKQRVAIARALVRNPKILLLDEATSALDSESEKIVQDALDAAKEGRTCITIAHRLTTIVDADVIYVIDAGKVKEQGTHKELLEQRGLYFSLFKLQSG